MIRKRGMLTFILLTVLSAIGAAQTAPPADIVYITATVTGPKKAAAPGLKVENFQLLEDGVEQKLTFFAPADGLWDMNVILANSMLKPGRADRTSTAIRDAVDDFQKAGNPLNKIKVDELHFGSDGLYAAIDSNLVDLQKTTNPRRALIVITDGFDKQYDTANSAVTNVGGSAGGDPANGLVEYSRKLNIPIYFLYTKTDEADASSAAGGGRSGTGGGTRGTQYSLTEGEILTNVADQTGGNIWFVEPLHQLNTQLKLLNDELKNKYVLGFKSTNDKKDDKWRKLKVTVKAPAGSPKLNIDVKPKYFVPKPLK